MDLYRHYQQIIEAYNRETDRATIEKTFEELLTFIETLTEEEERASREGLPDEYLPAFDLLCRQKGDLYPATRERIKRIAGGLLEAVKAEIAKMDSWREKEQTQAAVKTFIHDYLYDENTGLPIEAYTDEEVESLAEAFFRYVLQQYPSADEHVFVQK